MAPAGRLAFVQINIMHYTTIIQNIHKHILFLLIHCKIFIRLKIKYIMCVFAFMLFIFICTQVMLFWTLFFVIFFPGIILMLDNKWVKRFVPFYFQFVLYIFEYKFNI